MQPQRKKCKNIITKLVVENEEGMKGEGTGTETETTGT